MLQEVSLLASNTTNLNLYKKDPIADKDQTFNITTMMNENWDKIDQNAGQTATQLAQDVQDLQTHLADSVTDADGAHGLIVEYGSWTPTLAGVTTAGVNTYSLQQGRYYKIGKQITVSFRVTLSAKDAAMNGNILINGLPFAVADISTSGTIGQYGSIDLAAGYTQLGIVLAGNFLQLFQNGDNVGTAPVIASDINSTTTINGTATYFIA